MLPRAFPFHLCVRSFLQEALLQSAELLSAALLLAELRVCLYF